jgi:hypothetical protein
MTRASLNPAIFCRWPFSAISQQSQTRGLGDGGRPGRAAEFATDIRDVAVNGMRAQHELLCDLTITETARHGGEDLALATGQQNRVALTRLG